MRIRFENAEARFGDRVVVERLSVELTERRVGIIGLNGSGKTTFLRMVNGLVKPSAGRVITNGHDTAKDGTAVRRAVGYIFQNPANQIVLPLVKDDVALGLQSRRLGRPEMDRMVSAALDRVGITHLADRRAHELSGGEVQLAALASVLVLSPAIIVMDEPTNQLDLRNRNMVQRTIRSLPESVVVVTHDLDLVADFDRVLLFHEGKVAFDGAADAAIDRYLALAS